MQSFLILLNLYNMFSKLKHIKDLRSQAKTMQNALAEESVTFQKNGITVIMDGNMVIKSLSLPENTNKEKLEADVASAVNDTIKKVQRLMAEKMQQMGGLSKLGM